MQGSVKFDGAGKVLLGVGVILTLFTFAATMLLISVGTAFLGMMKLGLVLLGVYAIVGAVFAVVRGLRRG